MKNISPLTLLKNFYRRLLFAFNHKSFKTCVENGDQLNLCYHGKTYNIPKICPHQGAPMKDGFIHQKAWVCPWHGHRVELNRHH